MSGQYQDYPEILTIPQFAELFGISQSLAREWLRVSETPFGKVEVGVHYFRAGREPRIVKDRICGMAGILPKDPISKTQLPPAESCS